MATPTSINLNDSAPAAPTGAVNVGWQAGTARLDPNDSPNLVRDVSAYMPLMAGDVGSGGESGAVPAPAAGDAAAGKFLAADGSWEVPAGGSSFTAGGDLSGSSSSQEVVGIQNKPIDGGPTDGDVLKYSSSSGKWEPTALPSGPPNFADEETPSGSLPGTAFTLAHSPSPAGSLQLFLNGLLQRPAGNDYTLSGSSVAMTNTVATGDALLAWYRY